MTRHAKATGKQAVKAEVRERDGYRCTVCGLTNKESLSRYNDQLDVHRVVPGSKYTLEGCITVCKDCHKPLPRRHRGQIDRANGLTLSLHPKLLRAMEMLAERNASDLKQEISTAIRLWAEANELWPLPEPDLRPPPPDQD